jgi:hypothetical protein
MTRAMAPPAWIERVRQQAPQVLNHPKGARRVTGVEIRAPLRNRVTCE